MRISFSCDSRRIRNLLCYFLFVYFFEFFIALNNDEIYLRNRQSNFCDILNLNTKLIS